jgi:hypothetical protein
MEERQYATVNYKPHIPFEEEILKEDFMDLANSVRCKYGVHNISDVDKKREVHFSDYIDITVKRSLLNFCGFKYKKIYCYGQCNI